MEYTITPSDNGKYIYVKVRGDITSKRILEMIKEALALGEELGLNCYLTDVTEARNEDTATSNYNYAYSEMPKVRGGERSKSRVASLVHPADHSHDFVETVSRNAGIDVRLFTDLDKALKFLETGEFIK